MDNNNNQTELENLRSQVEVKKLQLKLKRLEKRQIQNAVVDIESIKAFFAKNKTIFIIVTVLLIFTIAILVSSLYLIGIRGVYVNVDNPYESYSFSPTTFEHRNRNPIHASNDSLYKGTWKRNGNTLSLTVDTEQLNEVNKNSEVVGKITMDYTIMVDKANDTITMSYIGVPNYRSIYKRVSRLGWSTIQNRKVNISFDLNGGKAEEINNLKIKFGSIYNYELPTPTRANATFKGWYNTKDGFNKEDSIEYTNMIPAYEDVTFYANWFLYSDCPGHKYDSMCVCTICGKVSHNYDENCQCIGCGRDEHDILQCGECTLCNRQIHTANMECECVVCGIQYHKYDELYQCEICSHIDVDNVYTNFGILLSIENDSVRLVEAKADVFKCDIPNYVTEIASDAFNGCPFLREVTIPDSVTIVGDYAFSYCKELKKIEISNSVTSIGNMAFYYCSSLEYVVIGNSVTHIGEQSFYRCDKLISVYYMGTKSQWDQKFKSISDTYLLGAARYYYIETEPTSSGDYWHYIDGVPTIW